MNKEIFTGNFGSGKTELSIARALQRAKAGEQLSFIDLDLVNPYFTSAMQSKLLCEAGIETIAPMFAGTGVDAPTMPPRALGILRDEDAAAVVDLGGDPVGAVTLGSLAPRMLTEGLSIYFVLNVFRPFTRTAADAADMLHSIGSSCRIAISGIINNSNLADETTTAELIRGQEVCLELSEMTGLPILYYGVEESLAAEAAKCRLIGDPIVIYRRNVPLWE